MRSLILLILLAIPILFYVFANYFVICDMNLLALTPSLLKVEFLDFTFGNICLPLYGCMVSAGFPSPADDYIQLSLNISDYVASNPHSTFFVRVTGNSMVDAYIPDQAILAVDKSVKAKHNDIIVCCLNGEFTVKRLLLKGKQVILKPENAKYKPIEISAEDDFRIWGKVVSVIHKEL